MRLAVLALLALLVATGAAPSNTKGSEAAPSNTKGRPTAPTPTAGSRADSADRRRSEAAPSNTKGSEAAPAAQGSVVLGQVTNGTFGGSVPADLPVFLHVFSDVEETGSYEATVTADGSFRFDDLSIAEGETVVVRIVYQGVPYFSDLHIAEPGQQVHSLPITIYETTEGLTDVLITQMHVFVSGADDRLRIGEHYLISNTGDRTCVGVEDSSTGRRATLTFTLPDGAGGLRFDGPGLGERFLERPGGLADTRPIPPGSAVVEAFFHYDLSGRERLRVERVFDVPVESIVLVVPEDGVSVDGEDITSAGTLDTEMGAALSYIAGPLAPGEPLVFTVIAGPRASEVSPAGGAPSSSARAEIALGLVTLAAAVVATYLLLRSPAPGPPPIQARPLVEAIAALGARFAAGDVLETAYRQRRASLLVRLRALLWTDRREHIHD